MGFDVDLIRKDFPALHQEVYGKALVYLDNAATTQKPQCVIDTLINYYSNQNSNIHRGVHYLSQQATFAYEEARKTVCKFLNAENESQIVFTRGTTESINLVASSFGKKFVNDGDEIIISGLEHHSNIVPWQFLRDEKNAVLKIIPLTEDGEINISELDNLISEKTKIIAVSHVSNSLGTINNIKEIIEKAHKNNIPVLIDGAQAVSHIPVDVKQLDCDFYCFSGHKIYAPMGVGVLYGKEKWLEEMPPYQGGGEMIKSVTFQKTLFNELPFKFEAGTPNVGDVIALKEALNYFTNIGYDNIIKQENLLLEKATDKLLSLGNIRIIGTSPHKASVISFLIDKIHPYDAGVIFDHYGIAVRTGTHCTQPVMDFFNITGTIRASFAFYNTLEEVDTFVNNVDKVKKMLG